MKRKIIQLLVVLISLLCFTSCETQTNSKDGRFVIVSKEWHCGIAWTIMQDTETGDKYLWVGNHHPMLLEDIEDITDDK